MPYTPINDPSASDYHPDPWTPRDSIELAVHHLKSLMPKEMQNALGPREMGPFEIMAHPRARGITYNADNTIAYNPAMINRHQYENDAFLAHELTHVGQNMQNPMWAVEQQSLPYENRPNEVDAFIAQSKFDQNHKDINLPSESAINGLMNARKAKF